MARLHEYCFVLLGLVCSTIALNATVSKFCKINAVKGPSTESYTLQDNIEWIELAVTPSEPAYNISGSDFHLALMDAAAYTCSFDEPGFPFPKTELFTPQAATHNAQLSLYNRCGELTFDTVCKVVSWWIDHTLLWDTVQASSFIISVDGHATGYGLIERHGTMADGKIAEYKPPT